MILSPPITKKLNEYEYFTPATLQEAISLVGSYDAVFLAGGTDVLPMMKFRELTPGRIINLKKIPNLGYIREELGELRIGALTTITDLEASDLIKRRCFALYEACEVFAARQIRNMATIGGNICRCSPSADTVPPLMSFDTDVKLIGPNGERKVPLADFFKGARRNVLDKEILTEVVIPRRNGKWGTAFVKLERNSSDLAKVSCAVSISMSGKRCEDIRIVLGAVADRTIRAYRAENSVRGREIEDGLLVEVARIIDEDIAPITDARSTAGYRKKASQVLVKRLIQEAVARSSA